MASTNTMSMVSSDCTEQIGIVMSVPTTVQSPLDQQSRTFSDGPVAILWDIENCPVPCDVRPEDVAGNIRMALRVHPVIKGAVLMFSAYGDFNSFPRRLREGCQRTGVKLVDVPNGRKDAADKAILIDMFLFALDNPPPSSIILISGDVDFAPALHILGQRGYTIILVIPSGVGVSSALCNAGQFVWDWPSVARGEGFVNPLKILEGNTDSPNEEEAIVYTGSSQSQCKFRDFSMASQSWTGYTSNSKVTVPCFNPTVVKSQSEPYNLDKVSTGSAVSCDGQCQSAMWVQPGDINDLKLQLVKLLEVSGGCLPLTRVPSEYQRIYGRPLYMSEYGASKLVNLFKKMSDAIGIDGKEQKKVVYLRSWKANQSMPPPILSRKGTKGKGSEEEIREVMTGSGSSDEVSDEEGVVIIKENSNNSDLDQFKHELQEILVSYSCGIFLSSFESVYEQRYKRPLDYMKLGFSSLEELFDKVRDVVDLHVEPLSKRKFLVAVGG